MPGTHSSSITSDLVGEEVRRVRRELGWTQGELGARIGASAAYVSAVELGRENLTLGALARLAEGLGRGLSITLPALDAEHRDVNLEQLRATSGGPTASRTVQRSAPASKAAERRRRRVER